MVLLVDGTSFSCGTLLNMFELSGISCDVIGFRIGAVKTDRDAATPLEITFMFLGKRQLALCAAIFWVLFLVCVMEKPSGVLSLLSNKGVGY